MASSRPGVWSGGAPTLHQQELERQCHRHGESENGCILLHGGGQGGLLRVVPGASSPTNSLNSLEAAVNVGKVSKICNNEITTTVIQLAPSLFSIEI